MLYPFENHPAYPAYPGTYPESIQHLHPSLRPFAQLDCDTHHRHMQISYARASRIQRLKTPIQTWIDVMGEEFGKGKATLRRCRLRREAGHAIDLDADGNTNQARLDREDESEQAERWQGIDEWFPLTQVCIISCLSGSVLTERRPVMHAVQ